MKLTQQLNQKQTQSIKINQQLQESLNLLKLSNQEILKYVNDLVKDNPFLDYEKNKKLNINKIEFNSNQPSYIENYKKNIKRNFNENTNFRTKKKYKFLIFKQFMVL